MLSDRRYVRYYQTIDSQTCYLCTVAMQHISKVVHSTFFQVIQEGFPIFYLAFETGECFTHKETHHASVYFKQSASLWAIELGSKEFETRAM